VLPIVNYRTSGGKFVVDIRPPVPYDGASDSRGLGVNTAQYVAVVEQDIKAHPDQWLWIHRRFKGELGPLRDDEWREGRSRT
jgi:KDO2-lipid IV(A) lauroyltransferase